MKDCCKICFKQYNGIQQRPRVLPCGHSYCNLCISSHLVRHKLVCPNCYKEHTASEPTDFPPNYELENHLTFTTFSPEFESQKTSFPSNKPQGISRLLQSSRNKHCKDMETVEAEVRENQSSLQGYELQLNKWKETHQKEMELHLSCAQKHREVIVDINKENQIVKDTSGHADNLMKELISLTDQINAANSDNELLLLMRNSSRVYDIAHEWNSNVKEIYPNSELILRSQELIQKSEYILQDWRQRECKSPPVHNMHLLDISKSSDEKMAACAGNRNMETELAFSQKKIKRHSDNQDSLQKEKITQTGESSAIKVKRIVQLDETSILNVVVFDLKSLNSITRILIECNKVFAVKQSGSEARYAHISFDKQDDICVHTLRKNVAIPRDAIILQHEEVIGATSRSGLTFLDLAAEGKPLGRLRFQLDSRGNLPLNFHLLCTGEMGHSYVDTGIIGILGRNRDNEQVALGDYESNDGHGGRGVVPGVDWGKEWDNIVTIYGKQKLEAGSVGGRLCSHNCDVASQFTINTNEMKNQVMIARFGKLDEEGLDVLKKALNLYCYPIQWNGYMNNADNLKKIVVADCGIILPRSLLDQS